VARRALGDLALAKSIAENIAALAERWAPHDDIEGLVRRTGEFVPRGIVEAPVISGDDAFSRDLGTREAARKKWDQFVIEDAAEISRLRLERDEQLALAADLEQRVAHLSKSLEKLAEVKRDFWVDLVVGKILGKANGLAQKRLPMMKSILDNRRRIVGEYDALLRRRDAAHAGHVQVLHALELIQGVRNPAQEPEAATAPETTSPEQGATPLPGGARSVVDQRIGDRVEARAVAAQREAYQARREAGLLKYQTDRIVRQTRPPTAGYPIVVQTQPTHAPHFQTEIRVLPPEQR
jgi:hypothetical protein